MKKLIAAALAATLVWDFNAEAHAAQELVPAGYSYEDRGWVSGFLLRAAMVCRDKYDWRAMARAGVELLAGDMRPMANKYPETVKAWKTHGAELFNGDVMADGVNAACGVASQNLAEARAIIANEPR
jgi:hypothetical protein